MKIGAFGMLVIVVSCALLGAIGASYYSDSLKSDQKKIAEFYSVEHAVSISPSDFTHQLDLGIIPGYLVDLRTKEAYAAGHMITAVNIPAGELSQADILAEFRKLPTDKPLILYCYSGYCMLSKNVGNFLSKNGIFPKHLTAGWYEINRDFSAYVVKGSLPGQIALAQNGTNGICPPNQIGSFAC